VGPFAQDRDWDPFDRTPADVLLAEDFARADLVAFVPTANWFLDHGVADLQALFPDEEWRVPRSDRMPADWFRDDPDDVRDQQANVAWLLQSLARLSQGPEAWESRWMEAVIEGDGSSLWIDAQKSTLRFLPLPERGPARPTAQLWVPSPQWHEVFASRIGRNWAVAEGDVPLTGTYAGHMELVRRLLEPHVGIAADFDVEVRWPSTEYPLVVRERRRWRSVLSPIYLQLLEALRRVTEGQRGAGFCRECGRPFLTLDSRRSSFCNDRERFRFTQRERRKRVDRERDALRHITEGRSRTTGGSPPASTEATSETEKS